jgi:hypothetical protein
LVFAMGQLRNAFGHLTLPQNSLSFSKIFLKGNFISPVSAF